jgi:hypothetical protein
LLTVLKTLASSTYNFTEQGLHIVGKSLMYNKKRNGPKTEPCGTPLVTGIECETEFLHLTA